MLKKNIFKFVLVLMLLCVGSSFTILDSKNVSADVSLITSADFSEYYSSLIESDFSGDFSGTEILDENNQAVTSYNLRDDIVIYAQNQNPYGLCWSFASNTAIATTLMKATNIYYDFSEAWVSTAYNYLSTNPNNDENLEEVMSLIKSKFANSTDYYVGGGSSFFVNDYLSRRFGVVMETDFPYEQLGTVCNQNIASAYNMYSEYTSDLIMTNVEAGFFDNYTTQSGQSLEIVKNSIKNHIYNHGAVFASMRWNTDSSSDGTDVLTYNQTQITYKIPNTNVESGHAISLIGWDDNIEINGTKGAWIALNSWGNGFGNDGVCYISYLDADFREEFWGYKFDDSQVIFKNTITDGNNIVTPSDSSIYKYAFSDPRSYKVLGKQIFYYNQDVTSEFYFSNSSTSILKNTNKQEGVYKIVTFILDTNTNKTHKYIDCLYVVGEAGFNSSLDSVRYYFASQNTNDYLNTNDGGVIKNNGTFAKYNDINVKDKDLILASSKDSGVMVVIFTTATYSDITNITCDSSYVTKYTPETNEQKGRFAFAISFNKAEENTFSFTFSNGQESENEKTTTKRVIILPADGSDKLVNVVYNLKGGKLENSSYRALVSSTRHITVQEPTKEGYSFDGWYTDNNFTSKLEKSGEVWLLKAEDCTFIDSPLVAPEIEQNYNTYINECNYAHLYAKWTLNNVKNLELTYDEDSIVTNSQFPITCTFSHELNKDNIKVKLYRNNALVQEITDFTSSYNDSTSMYDFAVQLTDEVTDEGTYTYKVDVEFLDQTTYARVGSSTEYTAIINSNITKISSQRYTGNGNVTWVDSEPDGAGYILNVYRGSEKTLVDSTDISNCNAQTLASGNKTKNVWDILNSAGDGEYSIEICKYVGEALEENYIGSVFVQNIKIIKVTFDSQIESLGKKIAYYDIDSKITAESFSTPGYTFMGWYLDKSYIKAWDFDTDTAQQNVELFANYQISEDVTIDSLQDVSGVYTKNATYNITVNATHNLLNSLNEEQKTLCSFSYDWYKEVNGSWQKINKTQNTLTIKNATDSGNYLCKVTFTDNAGFSVTTDSNIVNVNISKAPVVINHYSIPKDYVYNGEWQYITSGAHLDGEYDGIDNSDIKYQIEGSDASFKDSGKYIVTLKVDETDNYLLATATFEINVDKRKSEFTNVESYVNQVVTYCGQQPKLTYELNNGTNKEQTVTVSYKINGVESPIAGVGEYLNVVLTAQEDNNNYSSEVVINLTIKKANLTIKAHDDYSFWMFDLNKFGYEIIGEVYDEIDVEISCDADKQKIGSYKIVVSAEHANYNITLINGTYKVSAFPYYVGAGLLVVLILLAIILKRRKKYLIDFEEYGGEVVPPIEVRKKRQIKLPNCVREGYDFKGWYLDSKCTRPYNKKIKKGKQLMLHAKWEKSTNVRDNSKYSDIDQLLRDLKIKPEEEVVEKEEVIESPKVPEELTEEQKQQKAKDDFMNDIISRAINTASHIDEENDN